MNGTGAAHHGMLVLTDIGQEKRCITCGEYWPADQEFFMSMKKSPDRLSTRCLACIKEKTWSPTWLRG
jgi:hypothetical protein